MAKRVREERRRIVLLVVKGHPGYGIAQILEVLMHFHRQGKWPQASWDNARQDPYDMGLRQMLNSLESLGKVVGIYEDNRVRYFLPEHMASRAEALLPTEDEQAELIPLAQDFIRKTGMPLAFGVTPMLGRVVRIKTPRGLVDTPAHHADPNSDWLAALRYAISELGYEELVAA